MTVMATKNVLFILTNAAEIGPQNRKTGFFFPEVAHPFEVLDNAGIAVEFASPNGGAIPEDGYDSKDHAQLSFKESAAYRRMNRSRKLAEIDAADYDAIFVPGGLGPMVDITNDANVKRAVARAWNAGKLVTAVCHGPAALLGRSVEEVRSATDSPACQEKNHREGEREGEGEDVLPRYSSRSLRS